MLEPLLQRQRLRAGYGAIEVLRGVDLDVVRRRDRRAARHQRRRQVDAEQHGLRRLPRRAAATIRFDGARHRRARARPRSSQRGLVQVPEGRRIFPNLSVRENLELGSYRRGRAAPRAQPRARLRDLPAPRASAGAQRAGTLSGGEQQMLAIGRGLMAEPRLLILDEPSLGLSPLLVEEMFALIARAQRRRARRPAGRAERRAVARARQPRLCAGERALRAGRRRRGARRATPRWRRPIWECDEEHVQPIPRS